MAVNRRGSNAGQVRPFRPEGILPDGRLPVARPDGSELRQGAAALGSLAASFGGIADRLAQAEGDRAGTIAGNDEKFRPTGKLTLRGQAYDRAGTESYLNKLDASIRADMQDLYERARRDPPALKAGYDALLTEYKGQHLFPEIQGAFESQFAKLRMPYENRAQEEFDTGQRERMRGDLLVTLNDLQTTRSRQLASLDPNDPGAADVVIGTQDAIDAQYDRAVEQEIMSPAQAEEAKIEDRRGASVQFYSRQAAAMTDPADVTAFREEIRKQHAAGELPGLDGGGFDELDGELDRLERATRTGQATAKGALKQRLASYVERMADGTPPPAEEWTGLRMEAAGTADGEALVGLARQQLTYAKIIRDRPIGEAETAVRQLRERLTAKGATGTEADVLRFAETQLESERKRLATDPLGAAERRGLVGALTPLVLEAGNLDGLAGQVAARVAQADAVAPALGRPARYLRPDEVQLIRELAASDLDAATTIAGGLVSGAGARGRDVLRELGDQAPEIAQAGAILSNGGSPLAARDVLAGAQRNPETGQARPDVSQAVRFTANSALGNAFVAQPEDSARVKEAARNIARVRLEAAGVAPDSSAADTIYGQALLEATGAITHDGVQYGGLAEYDRGWLSGAQKIVAPAGVRADAFRDVVRAVTDGDLGALDIPPQAEDGSAIPARDLHNGIPVAVAGGYAFAHGDPAGDDPRFVRGADGQPFVLPLEQLTPMLRARVPGAFLGD